MYRDGLLPSGEPLSATVAGDVPVRGTQFSCTSCHGRSGMGAGEGTIRVPPVSALLFEPSPQRRRPGYDLASLGRALRNGVDAAGRRLDPLMPRYQLADSDVAVLVAYLGALSAAPSAGVSDQVVRFAMPVAEDAEPATRAGVLEVLRQYVFEKNQQTRLERRRPGHGAAPGTRRPTTYREWALEVWTLRGERESWRAQLEARSLEQPVFALLGGLVGPEATEVAAFCETHEMPWLFPSLDLVDGAASGFYSLHFSRGLDLEADLVAADLELDTVRVVQLHRDGAGALATRRLSDALRSRGVRGEALRLAPGASLAGALARARLRADDVLVLWLARGDLSGVSRWPVVSRIYLSSTLLGRDLDGIAAGASLRAAHPFRLPGEPDPALRRFHAWLSARGISLVDERRQAEAYFACMAANDGLLHGGRFFVRDYLLDVLDHAQGLTAYLPIHPRPSSGPGQRFLAKGGYLLPIEQGRARPERAVWRVP